MRRRILGIAALLFMANTTFAATATACLMTGGSDAHAPSSAATRETHHQHHAAPTTSDESSSEGPTKTPRHEPPLPTCCEALAPCTSVVSAATVVTVPISIGHGVSIDALGEFAPASRLDAPDTPPPKA